MVGPSCATKITQTDSVQPLMRWESTVRDEKLQTVILLPGGDMDKEFWAGKSQMRTDLVSDLTQRSLTIKMLHPSMPWNSGAACLRCATCLGSKRDELKLKVGGGLVRELLLVIILAVISLTCVKVETLMSGRSAGPQVRCHHNTDLHLQEVGKIKDPSMDTILGTNQDLNKSPTQEATSLNLLQAPGTYFTHE
ncbi:MAG: hypothetical protein TREMPRED_003743 [Tremellales sp. Tagirdzhanova-0007]|nr:MAG: hypothetical protein TREMPRED_003743 [Tremellales sp. Tagirdzhanova-0007]